MSNLYNADPRALVLDKTKELGWLTPIQRVANNRFNRTQWLFRCRCGNFCVQQACLVNVGRIKSCGCACGRKKPEIRVSGFRTLHRGVVKNTKRGSKTLACTVSQQDLETLWETQNGVCALSGVPLKLPETARDEHSTASVDRIDSAKGYVEGNVQFIHKSLNTMKMNLPQGVFINMCKAVAEYRTGKA